MRSLFVFVLLLLIRGLSRLFYRIEMTWVGELRERPWSNLSLVSILNHTSLFEPIFAGGVPLDFLWRIARHGVVPVAQKTVDRPLVGPLFRVIAAHVVPISRQRDVTWAKVLEKIRDPEAMVIILPEGRMMRRNGLDKNGNPMTVRGGIADILEALPGGRMLLAYSEGLHHVQVPGESFPRLFKTVRMSLETVDVVEYRERLLARAGNEGFRGAVIADLTERRDRYCRPPLEAPALAQGSDTR